MKAAYLLPVYLRTLGEVAEVVHSSLCYYKKSENITNSELVLLSPLLLSGDSNSAGTASLFTVFTPECAAIFTEWLFHSLECIL